VLLAGAATQILRAIQSERVFAAVEKGKYEHERFYRASELLRTCLTPDQVYDTTFKAAREIVEFDLAAVTLYDKDKRRHTIAARLGRPEGRPRGQGLRRQRRPGGHGGQEQALPMPANGELRDASVAGVHAQAVLEERRIAAGLAASSAATRPSAP